MVVCLYVLSPATDWWPVRGVPCLSPYTVGVDNHQKNLGCVFYVNRVICNRVKSEVLSRFWNDMLMHQLFYHSSCLYTTFTSVIVKVENFLKHKYFLYSCGQMFWRWYKCSFSWYLYCFLFLHFLDKVKNNHRDFITMRYFYWQINTDFFLSLALARWHSPNYHLLPDTNKYNWVMMLSGVTGTECKGFSGYQALEEAI